MISKNKWFGKCAICKKPETSLATTKTSSGRCVNYTISRSCDMCQKLIHAQIETILTALWKHD
jgi:hypothetical protein